MRHDVFISYKSENYSTAAQIKAVLEYNGLACWMAPDNMEGGTNYALEIPAAIRASKAFVLLVNSHSMQSEWIPKETDIAINAKKRVLPFFLEDINPTGAFSLYLTNVQWYPAFQNYDAALERMTQDICKLVGVTFVGIPSTKSPPQPKRSWLRSHLGLLMGAAALIFALLLGLALLFVLPERRLNILLSEYVNTGKSKTLEQIEVLSDSSVFGAEGYKRRDIASITFKSSLKSMPEDAWNVSEYPNGHVMAWVTKDTSGNLNLTIAATGGVIAPVHCRELFAGYINATKIDLSGFRLTDATSSTERMFMGCYSLTSLDVSGFQTSSVKNFASMFYDCTALTELDVSSFDTANATSMYAMFFNCSSLTSLDVSTFDTSNVDDFAYMFRDCTSLTELNPAKFNTVSATTMHSMFYNCSSLTSLDVSRFDTSNVNDFANMFRNCSSLTELNVSNFNTTNATTMYAMFYNCSGLTSLNVSQFDTSNVNDFRFMFADCSKLEELNVSKFSFESAEQYGSFAPDDLLPNWRALFEPS